MNDNDTVAVIGLGLMGTAITERLLERGCRVVVWNRTRGKADPLLALGAQWSDHPLAQSDRVIVSLYTSGIVGEVLRGMEADLHPGQYVIDTTTGEPEEVTALRSRLAQRGVRYLDAPISGSSEQTRRGEATVMVGGEADEFAACADLWPVLGNRVFHVGPCGAASKMKLVTNLVLGLNRAALAEGLSFAEALGIVPSAALEVLQGSVAYSRTMDTKGRKMIAGDYQPQARLSQHAKDVRIILEGAERTGIELPLSKIHAQLLASAEALGCGELDNSAIIEVYRRSGAADGKGRVERG